MNHILKMEWVDIKGERTCIWRCSCNAWRFQEQSLGILGRLIGERFNSCPLLSFDRDKTSPAPAVWLLLANEEI